jgi:uncharacterized membrane protein YdjX (TVP38/TMEM64 family)
MSESEIVSTLQAEATTAPKSRRKLWWLLLLIALVVALAFTPIGTWADGIRLWVEHQGAWGPLFLILLMGLWGQLFPTMPLQLVVAGLYGLWYGALITYAGASLAMLISLLVGRFLLRAWLADFLQRFKLTRSIDAALVAESWRGVALIRLSNAAPAHAINWVLSVSRLPIVTIFVVSIVTKTPGIIVFAAIGQASLGGAESRTHPLTWVMLVIGISATVLVIATLGRRTRQLMQAEKQTEATTASA